LKRGQSYLFSDNYKNEIHVALPDGNRQAVSFTYSSANNRIDYLMPTTNAQQTYSVDVVSMSKLGTGAVAESTGETQNVGNEDDQINVNSAQANNVIRNDIGKSLLNYSFTTSRYGTFAQKMAGNPQKHDAWMKVSSTIVNLMYELTVSEPFDVVELVGTEYTGGKPLITGTATLTDDYYKQYMYPVLYKNYPQAGVTLTNRDPLVYGVPPARAINLLTSYVTEIENGKYNGYSVKYFPFVYGLPQVYQEDFSNIQNQLVNRYLNSAQLSQFDAIVNGICPAFMYGNYPVTFQYTTPDGTKGTAVDFNYFNSTK
jgi:hypothetical protein